MTNGQRTLIETFLSRLEKGITRHSVTRPSHWAESYRVMKSGDKWSFRLHPWLREMHDSRYEFNVGRKSAQMGFTECVLNVTFYHVDIHGRSVLYVLPTERPDASEFSTTRFDPAIESSEHLVKVFSDNKNVGVKRAGSATVYIRGSNSRSALKSVPVNFIVLDELDEMDAKNVTLAQERVSGQSQRLIWMISTPTIAKKNIDYHYEVSTKNHFHFPCPSCSRFIELKFPESLVITGEDPESTEVFGSHLICYECKARLEHEDKPDFLSKGIWVPTHKDRVKAGWHINQLYSCELEPHNIAISYLNSLRNPADEQEFYNSKLGKPHAVEGAQVTDNLIIEAIDKGRYVKREMRQSYSGIRTMGIDVGKRCHVEVTGWYIPDRFVSPADINTNAIARVIDELVIEDFDDLFKLFINYKIDYAVIDAHPERRKAFEFARYFRGKVRCCIYNHNIQSKLLLTNDSTDEPIVGVDRTAWLDVSIGRFHKRTITLPSDTSLEYKEHIKVLSRMPLKDKKGNLVYKYVSATDADHYAHARNYSEVALQLFAGGGRNTNIDAPV